MRIAVATCQFATSPDPAQNVRHVLRQVRQAKARGADVAHFCEGALSGYAGNDMPSYDGFDWDSLRGCSEQVLACAKALGIWVLCGSAHRLSGRRKTAQQRLRDR